MGGFDQAEDFFWLGVTSGLELREDQLAVERNFERTTRAMHQLHGGIGKPPLDFGRQTGGPGFVVSNYAVLYGDLHHRSFPCR